MDAAQGAEEMVNQLTYKTLQQEELVQKLEDEKADLVSWMDFSLRINYKDAHVYITTLENAYSQRYVHTNKHKRFWEFVW